MPNPITTLVDDAIAGIASALGGQVTTPGAWFDGFWDYFVQNRPRLERGPVWEIAGMTAIPWAIDLLAPDELDRPLFEAHLFVEAKDERPAAMAPWPVSSVVIGEPSPAKTGDPDRFDRSHDRALAEDLLRLGFALRFGYWGVRCDAQVPREAERVVDRVRAILAALPEALRIASAVPASHRKK